MSKHVPFFLAGTILVAVTGCKVEPPKPPLVETVAVLPFDSESNDINAPDILQRYVYLALKPSVYRPLDIKEVNEKLEKAGIVDGGQLPAVDPTKLGKDLGVQALIYGNVASFEYLNVGFYRHRKVSLELKMVEVTTGNTLWENTATALTPAIAVNSEEAQKEFARGLADQAADKLFNSPLDDESRRAVMKVLANLPGFSFYGFASDDKTPNPAAQGGKDFMKDIIRQK